MACKQNCNCYLNNLVGIDPKCTNFDMTDLYRVTITDSMTDKEKALFQGYNDNCETVEDLWIELDLQLIDAMEAAAKKLQNRNAKQRERDNRNDVCNLHKQGFTLAEIASITKIDHETIYNYIHRPIVTKKSPRGAREAVFYGTDPELHKEVYGAFDDIPDEIRADLQEADFDLD